MDCTVRREPDAESMRLLNDYFGGKRCVVDGGDNAEWHHLDDDASNHRFEDFVPLGSGLNRDLRDARRRGSPTYVPAVLLPDRLADRAEICQSSWDVARAYGLSRLAHYVGRAYTGATRDELLLHSANCLRFLRHRPSSRLIDDVVRRDILSVTADSTGISAYPAVRVLFEIACLYSEHDQTQRAVDIHRLLGRRLRPRWDGDGWYANALLRAATAIAVVEARPRDTVARLRRAAEHARAVTGVRVASDLFAALHLYGAQEYTKARDVLEPMYEMIVPPLEAYAEPAHHLNRNAIPPLSVSPAVVFLQTYTLVRAATERAARQRRTDLYETILTRAFLRSGVRIGHDVPFSWRAELPGRESRFYPSLTSDTTQLLDDAVSNLVAVLRP
jgi:hypothetical protein